MLLTEADVRRITGRMLGVVKAQDASISVTSRLHSHLRFADNTFHTSGQAETVGADITVWLDRKRGSASTSDLSDAALDAAVAQAESLARISPVDAEYLPTLGPQVYRPSIRYAESTAALPLDVRARDVGQAMAAAEKAGVVSAGFHQAEVVAEGRATKNGNVSFERRTLVSFGMTARTREGNGSGFFLRNHFDLAKLDAGRVSREAIRRAVESKNARTLPPGVYPVILESQAVADLLSNLTFDARAAEEGRSAFSAPNGKSRIGEVVFDERLNISSDPWDPAVPASPVAQAGIPAAAIALVRSGRLEELTYSRYWAQTKGRAPTPGPVNQIVTSNVRTPGVDEMIRTAPRALLVSRFWYIRRVDPRTASMTGLTRDGVWLVENGKLQSPVRNFRFNQSLIQMLAPGNVEDIGLPERVGASEEQGSDSRLVPALRLKTFNFTSASDAI